MSLYVRVFSDFFSHRKTARLRGMLGDAALWLPIRLWAYAAEHQPDGDFSRYEPGELAVLLGYNGDASNMLQALIQACFMDADPLRIHEWDQHNGYHVTFAERARLAAQARWAKKGPHTPKETTKTTIEKEKERQALLQACSKHALSLFVGTPLDTPEVEAAFEAWIAYRLTDKKPKSWESLFAGHAKALLGYSAEEATEALNRSTANQYQGLFPRRSRPNASKAPERPQSPIATAMLLKEQEGLKRAEMQRLRFKHGCGEWPRDFRWSESAPAEVKEQHRKLAAEVRELEEKRSNIKIA